jgi:hypothetical protein
MVDDGPEDPEDGPDAEPADEPDWLLLGAIGEGEVGIPAEIRVLEPSLGNCSGPLLKAGELRIVAKMPE